LELESRFGEVLNSDLRHSDLPGTTILDVTKTPPPELKSRFDFVINVSTLEEVHSSQIKVLDNLLTMAKPGGYVLITFDLPGLQLESFEALFGKTIEVPETPISGATSAIADERWGDLRFGSMVIQKS
jgi:hypothetical protein